MSTSVYESGVLREHWDDSTRTYTTYDAEGVQTSTRAYTPEEDARADAEAAQRVEQANQQSIEVALGDALATLQAVIDQTNADLRTDPSQEIKDIARAVRRIIRLLTRRLDGTA